MKLGFKEHLFCILSFVPIVDSRVQWYLFKTTYQYLGLVKTGKYLYNVIRSPEESCQIILLCVCKLGHWYKVISIWCTPLLIFCFLLLVCNLILLRDAVSRWSLEESLTTSCRKILSIYKKLNVHTHTCILTLTPLTSLRL